jgi:hypothetical protein
MMKYQCHANFEGAGRTKCASRRHLNRIVFVWKLTHEDPDVPPVNVLHADSLMRHYRDGEPRTRRGCVFACDVHVESALNWCERLAEPGIPINIMYYDPCGACGGVGDGQDLAIPPQTGNTPDGRSWLVYECPTCEGAGCIPCLHGAT